MGSFLQIHFRNSLNCTQRKHLQWNLPKSLGHLLPLPWTPARPGLWIPPPQARIAAAEKESPSSSKQASKPFCRSTVFIYERLNTLIKEHFVKWLGFWKEPTRIFAWVLLRLPDNMRWLKILSQASGKPTQSIPARDGKRLPNPLAWLSLSQNRILPLRTIWISCVWLYSSSFNNLSTWRLFFEIFSRN